MTDGNIPRPCKIYTQGGTPPCKIHTVCVWRILQGGVCVPPNSSAAKFSNGVLTFKGGPNYISTVQQFTRPLDVSIKMRQTSGKPECGVVSIFPDSSTRHSGYNAGLGWWGNGFGTAVGGKPHKTKIIVHKAAWQTVRIYAAADGKVYYYLNGALERTETDSKYTKGGIRLGNNCVGWQYKDIVVKTGQGQNRQYCGQRLAGSTDGFFEGEETELWTPRTKFGPVETSQGHKHAFQPVLARYVRYWCARNSVDNSVNMLEAAIWGLPDAMPNPDYVNIDQQKGVLVIVGPGM
jgi:hypothetical protein